MQFGNLKEMEASEVKSTRTGELYTLSKSLTNGTGITSFSVTEEEIAPGNRGSAPHSHSTKDEIFFVLSGSPTVYVNGEKRVISSGEYVVFQGGLNEVHYVANETEENVRLLMISSRSTDDTIHYQHDS